MPHTPVTLDSKPAERSVKRVARAVFRLVRSASSRAQSVPGLVGGLRTLPTRK